MMFRGEEAKRFRTVKDHRGVKQNTELVRILISDEYNAIERNKAVKPNKQLITQGPVEVAAE